MKKKIAIPVDNNGNLDGHFGHCKYFAIFCIHENKILSEEIVTPPPHEPGLLPVWLAERGVTDIIAGGMGQKAVQIFNTNGVNAFVGAPQLSAKELTEGYLTSTLNFSSNYCDH